MKTFWIFVVGISAGVLITIASIFLIVWKFSPTPEQIATKEIQRMEKSLGYSCDDVNARAIVFINGPLPELVRIGNEGGDWVYEGYKQHYTEIHWLNDSVRGCVLLYQYKVGFKLATRNDFLALEDVFSLLDSLTTPWAGTPPHTSDLKPEAFDKLVVAYRNLTLRSSGSAQKRAAP